MKKMISLLCVCAMSLSLIACGSNTNETMKETDTQTAVESQTEDVEDSGDIVMQEAYKVVEAAQGQQIQIDAKYGTYRVAVTKVEEVDWWYRKHETNVKHVVVVHYEA